MQLLVPCLAFVHKLSFSSILYHLKHSQCIFCNRYFYCCFFFSNRHFLNSALYWIYWQVSLSGFSLFRSSLRSRYIISSITSISSIKLISSSSIFLAAFSTLDGQDSEFFFSRLFAIKAHLLSKSFLIKSVWQRIHIAYVGVGLYIYFYNLKCLTQPVAWCTVSVLFAYCLKRYLLLVLWEYTFLLFVRLCLFLWVALYPRVLHNHTSYLWDLCYVLQLFRYQATPLLPW